ncbi:hypothetical protein FOBRF1_003917 [Fusarium oxysporum]
MASTSRIPHLLEPYISLPPESSLNLVTSVLGASANWLVLRHVYSYLRGSTDGDESAKDTGVVLLSFMRDGAFWKEGATKLGLDLDALSRAGRFTFIDGFSGLYGEAKTGVPGTQKERTLRSTKLADIKREIEGAIADLRASRKILVIDQLDALLAVTDDSTTSLTLQDAVLSLRSLVHSTLLTLSADMPLVATQVTRLEREHASLVLSSAHEADMVMALRMLDTGTARDVSGVVRITGPGAEGLGGATETFPHKCPLNRHRISEEQKGSFFYFLAQTCKTPCPCSKPHLYAPFIHEPTNTTARPNHHPNSGSNQIVLGSRLML